MWSSRTAAEEAIKRIRYSVVPVRGEDPESSTARVAMFIELFSEFRPPVVAEASKRIAHRCRFWPSIAEAREILIEVSREMTPVIAPPRPPASGDRRSAPLSQAGAERIAASLRDLAGPSSTVTEQRLVQLGRTVLRRNGYEYMIDRRG